MKMLLRIFWISCSTSYSNHLPKHMLVEAFRIVTGKPISGGKQILDLYKVMAHPLSTTTFENIRFSNCQNSSLIVNSNYDSTTNNANDLIVNRPYICQRGMCFSGAENSNKIYYLHYAIYLYLFLFIKSINSLVPQRQHYSIQYFSFLFDHYNFLKNIVLHNK